MDHCKTKCGFRNTWISLIVFVLAGIILFGLAGCSEDDPVIESYDMSGRYELMYAEFLVEVDLDGDGPLAPTTDAKSFIYDIFDVRSECDGDADVVFSFTDTIVNSNELAVFITCTDNNESTYIASYVPNVNATNFYLYKPTLNDPGHLINWQGSMLFAIVHKSIVNGRRKLSGYTGLRSNYNPDQSMEIEFAFKEVVPQTEG